MENNTRKGAHNRASGLVLEKIISAACSMYHDHGQAVIMKTPEPMRPISKPDAHGRFTACFTKKAQPDFHGTVKGGRSIVIEAKHTDADRIYRRVVSDAQEEILDAHMNMGADCYVLVSIKFKQFFMVPWIAFRDMKMYVDRFYMTPEDMKLYQVPIIDGRLHFLGEEQS